MHSPQGLPFFMLKTIYLDESGDLGWKFTAPFRAGGSSRFLTIAYIVIPNGSEKIIERFVKDIYILFSKNPAKEFKATDMSSSQKQTVTEKIVELLNKNPDFIIGSITVKKERVMNHIRSDSNKLYNFMIGQSILPKISNSPKVSLVRDNRSVKVQSGNSCIDYLQIKLYFDYGSPTKIIDFPTNSHTNKGVIFIDWITNFVWSHYEDGKSVSFDLLANRLINETLYF